eukprot:gene12633-14838_t
MLNWIVNEGRSLYAISQRTPEVPTAGGGGDDDSSRILIPNIDGSGEFYQYTANDGFQKLPYTLFDIIASSPLLATPTATSPSVHVDSDTGSPQNTLYIGSKLTTVIVVDATTGHVIRTLSQDGLWEDGCPSSMDSEEHPNTLLFTRADYKVVALDPKSGTERWNLSLGEYTPFSGYNSIDEDDTFELEGSIEVFPLNHRYKLFVNKREVLVKGGYWETLLASPPVSIYAYSHSDKTLHKLDFTRKFSESSQGLFPGLPSGPAASTDLVPSGWMPTPRTKQPATTTPSKKTPKKKKKQQQKAYEDYEPIPMQEEEIEDQQQVEEVVVEEKKVEEPVAAVAVVEKQEPKEEILQVNGNTRIGKIEMTDRVLGTGSCGTIVYEGFLEGRKVAIKRMLKEFIKFADREVSLLLHSDEHMNVVRYHAKEEDGEFIYLALSYCRQSLDNYVEASGVSKTPAIVTPAIRRMMADLLQMSFLVAASDYLEFEKPSSPMVLELDSFLPAVVDGEWWSKLDATLIDNIGRYRKYNGKSLRDLLRVIRNKFNHYRDLPEDVQQCLGHLPDGFLDYFKTRFPKLIISTYLFIKKNLRSEPYFRQFFVDHTAN